MPKSSPQKLKYMAEYEKRPEQKAKHVELRRERRHAIAEGVVHKGDGKDLAHLKAADNGGHATKSNLKVESAHNNRNWRKGQSGYKVPNEKK